ncbi:hypothetical protein HF086_013605 [Spodoptera exigua]|uniref:Uncharacterized protein n=1 Tax=Spodoptera exigua TaxID=7107 RepID=A0A922MUU5_SPOEX|nr:hypothetical protein HF086_013605 [Spodoptera exigua]
MIALDLNVVYGIRIITTLIMCLQEWTNNVKETIKNDTESVQNWNEVFDMYNRILKLFDVYKKCFRILLRYDKIDQVVFPILIMAWIIMEAAVILALCVQCEKFYMAVEEAESTCIQLVMSTKCSSKNTYFKFCQFPFQTFFKGGLIIQ